MNRRFQIISLLACIATASIPAADHSGPHAAHTPKFPPPGPGAVNIVARDYMFEMPARIPSGWTEFRFFNAGMAPHFFLLSLLPPERTLADYINEVGPAFGAAMAAIREDKGDRTRAYTILGEKIPAWFASVRQMGGAGFIEPGGLAVTTAKLVPGEYVVECYIKADDGRFHTELGMIRALTVTSADSGMAEPSATLTVTLSNGRIDVPTPVPVGRQTVAVKFNEHPEQGLGNDVHLVKLESDTDLDAVIRWVDWMNLDGLTHHTPARFLGGTQEMPLGSTAYVTFDFTPGEYAWIAESGAANGMVLRFEVE
ncbi:MAG TPA: hypothetical protein VIK52_01090 [Opitutaceae bacterium]